MTAITFANKGMREVRQSEIKSPIVHLLFAAVLFSMAALCAATPSQALNSAEGYARNVSKTMLSAINRGSAQQFRALMRRHSNIRRIGNFSLGRFARKLPTAKRAEYYRLVENWMARTFIKHSGKLKGQGFAVIRSHVKNSRNIVVSGKIIGGDAQIKYRLVKTNNGYAVLDINVLGFWMTQLMKSTFTGKLKNANGDFTVLFAYLR